MPREFGPQITFRLPADLHRLAADRAEARGMNVNAFLLERLTEALRRQQHRAEPLPLDRNEVTPRWKMGKTAKG